MTNKEQILTPIMRWFLFAMVLANIGGQMVPLLLPIYMTELGATVGQVGLVFTITSSVMLFLQVLGGWISDSVGRLRAIAVGSIGGVAGYVAMVLAPTWEWMIVAVSISGIAYAMVGPSFGAFIAEHSREDNRGRVYGVTDSIFQITGVLGPPLGGFLAGAYGFRPMIIVSGLLYGAAAIIRIWMATATRWTSQGPEPDKLTFASFRSSLSVVIKMVVGGGVITWIFMTDGIRDIAFRLSQELTPLYLEQIAGISIFQIGLLGSIFSGAMMISPLASGRISDKYGERVPITMGFLLVFAGFMIFLYAPAFPMFVLSWIVFGTGVGLLSPAYQSLISKVVPQKNLGAFSGIFRSSLGLISLPAPFIGAQLWERYTPRLPFIITAAAALVTVVPAWFKFRLPDKPKEVSEQEVVSG
jgi:DHA1 family tetracycline resistance protein-like MFS transporter